SLLLSADYVPASLVEAIERTWRCPVFLHYGMTETCYGLAVQCAAREVMHLRSGEFLIEVADPLTGAPLPPGQEGEILLTTLESEALPLIRYRTGDIGRLAASACGCGSTLPALARVSGRLENLRAPINIHRLDELLFAHPTLRNYAARLEGDCLQLTVDLIDGGAAPDARVLSDTLGVAVSVECAPLPPGRTPGKRRMGYA
ncbi:MAG: AMP-binding protein, partial [Clostridiales bacterium]|nr:AMP-binding protein [Clostridiales bacterium]